MLKHIKRIENNFQFSDLVLVFPSIETGGLILVLSLVNLSLVCQLNIILFKFHFNIEWTS